MLLEPPMQQLKLMPATPSPQSNSKSFQKPNNDNNFSTTDLEEDEIPNIDSRHFKTFESLKNQKDIISPQIYSVSYKTYIEFDLHGGDYHISDSFDWIAVLKEFLDGVKHHQIDAVNFIPGQGKHTNTSKVILKEPILRPLTLITTKMLGFDSYLDDANLGIVICPISQCGKDELERRNLLFKVFAEMDFFDIQSEEITFINDEKYEQKKTIIQIFHKLKEKVPNMLDECIEIISIWKKNEDEAIEFAETFMSYFEAENLFDLKKGPQRKQMRRAHKKDDFKIETKKIYIQKLVDKLEQKYKIDHEMIERIVNEHQTEEKCEKVIDMLLPFYFVSSYFRDFILSNESIPILTLLDIFNDCESNPDVVQEKLLSKSFKDLEVALDLMKIKTKIDSKRDYNEFFNKLHLDMPKFLPSIEIDLENANIDKAKQSICYIMDGLRIGRFCEMVLVFHDADENDDFCKFDDIYPFIEEKALKDGIKLVERIRTKSRFCYLIIDN